MPYTIITTNPQQQMQQMQMQMQNTTHIPIPQHNKSNNIIIPAHSTAAASSGNSINKNSILLRGELGKLYRTREPNLGTY